MRSNPLDFLLSFILAGSSRMSMKKLCTALGDDDELYTQLWKAVLALKADVMDAEDGDEGAKGIALQSDHERHYSQLVEL